jgi:hypothetical protein
MSGTTSTPTRRPRWTQCGPTPGRGSKRHAKHCSMACGGTGTKRTIDFGKVQQGGWMAVAGTINQHLRNCRNCLNKENQLAMTIHTLPSQPSTESQANSRRKKWIMSQVQMVLAAYRRDEFADAESFILQLSCILDGFPDKAIEAVCSPRTGIQRRSKFPPSLAEIATACEQEAERLARVAKFAAMSKSQPLPSPPAGPGSRANLLIAKEHPSYQAACRWAESADPRDFKYDEDGRGLWMSRYHHDDLGALRSYAARRPNMVSLGSVVTKMAA